MNPALTRQLAITAGLMLARLASRVLVDATPGDDPWVDRVIEILHFGAETWLRQALSLRPPPPPPEPSRADKYGDDPPPPRIRKRRPGWRVVTPGRRRRAEGERDGAPRASLLSFWHHF